MKSIYSKSGPPSGGLFLLLHRGVIVVAINVAQLLKLAPGASRRFDFAEEYPEFAPEIELAAPIRGHVDLLRTSRGILASNHYTTAVTQACGRCLEPTVAEIQGSSQDEFMPRLDIVTGQVNEEQAESDELVINDRHLLDLTEVIRQDLLTRLPLQPLCAQDCPGLCVECGQNLRDGRCSYHLAAESSSPFARLSDLLSRAGRDEPSPN